jgi:tRNA pseudouridine55 synthase
MPVYAVDKPLGLSSHQVVAQARRLLDTRQVGHAGTLDPLATGVLVLLVDAATKLSPYLTESDKGYLAWVAFGAATPTLDAEGPLAERADPSALDAERVAASLPPFLTLSEQLPPSYSAIKKGGVKGYEAARQGEALDLPPRPAGYRRLELLGFAPERGELPHRFAPDADGCWRPDPEGLEPTLPPTLTPLPTALIYARVRAGTYLRAFARDLGAALGLPAHLSGLVRTSSGALSLENAAALDALPDSTGLPLTEALPYPLLQLDADAAVRVRQGQRPPLRGDGRYGLVDPAGDLAAVVEVRDGRSRLLRVWH